MKKDPPQRTKSAKRRLARHVPHRPAPERRTASSLPEAFALVLLVLAGAVLVFVLQGSPDLWDQWHRRAMYGMQWSAGCAR